MGVRKSQQPIRIAAVLIGFPLLSETFDSPRDRKVAAAQQRLVPECVRDKRGLLTLFDSLKCNAQCEHRVVCSGVMNVPYHSSSRSALGYSEAKRLNPAYVVDLCHFWRTIETHSVATV